MFLSRVRLLLAVAPWQRDSACPLWRGIKGPDRTEAPRAAQESVCGGLSLRSLGG